MSALDKAGKAAASTFPSVVPILIYAALGYFLFKGIQRNIRNPFGDELPGIKPDGVLGMTPDSIEGRITGKILAPKNGDQVRSAGVTNYTYSMTLEATNPFEADREVLLEVKTREFPHLMPETGSTWSSRIVLKPGRNVLKATVARSHAISFGGSCPAYAELVIDGRPATQAVYYEID